MAIQVDLLICRELTIYQDAHRQEGRCPADEHKFYQISDMANMTFLNEASILDNLRQGYIMMRIYTYSGLFCVINPYKWLPIYGAPVTQMHKGR
ncbi:myosin-16-like [Ahaetulla prasina]|uniref:myosin-16-like n=1 Tax=Ahaetulla prasina TaxID=499056 RepID=UPI00264729D6|nr:myosin-16-like [Ahaetulla prasina]